MILEVLAGLPGVSSVYDRSDVDVRLKEGLPRRSGLRAGTEPTELVEVLEGNRCGSVDVHDGHRTGFYLDQRLRRDAAMRCWRRGLDVLNAFS